jgi:hypothetical protein
MGEVVAEVSKVTEQDMALEKATTTLGRGTTGGDTALQEDATVEEAAGGGSKATKEGSASLGDAAVLVYM